MKTKPSSKTNILTALLLVFFFPVGLYLMWAKTNWSKKAKWIVTGILAVIVVIIGNSKSGSATSQPSQSPSPTVALQTVQTPTPAPITLEGKVKAALPDDVKNAKIDIQPDSDPVTGKALPGLSYVAVDTNLDQTFWDLNSAKSSARSMTTKIVKVLFPLDKTINSVIATFYVPTTDAYGKKGYDMLLVVTVNRGIYNKIDFTNFDSNNWPEIAESYHEGNIK